MKITNNLKSSIDVYFDVYSKSTTGEQPTLIFFHGGPGFSREYFNPFLDFLHLNKSWTLLNVDLPNHGDSIMNDRLNNFSNHIKIFGDTIEQFDKKFSNIHFIFHSFSTRFFLELFNYRTFDFQNIKSIIFLTTPTKFETKKLFDEKIKEMGLEYCNPSSNLEFKEYYKKLLPLYFHLNNGLVNNNGVAEISKYLFNNIRVIENSFLNDHITDFNNSFNLFRKCYMNDVHFIEGANDLVVPNDNIQTINELKTRKSLKVFESFSHFPFIDDKKAFMDHIESIVGL